MYRNQGMGDTQPQMVYVRHCCPRDFAGLALGLGLLGWGGIWGFKMKYDTKGYTRVDLDGLQYTSMFLKVEVSSYPLIPIVMVQFSHDPSW